jgi:hypothetical protein
VELAADWVVGFVDGEGCFHVSLTRHPEMSMGFQVLPEFVVVQHERDEQILQALKRFFQGGVVRRNHGDRLCLRIRKLSVLFEVCAFFERHPLKTKKHVDFRKFRQVLLLMRDGHHLTREGLLEVISLAREMNTADRPSLDLVKQELVSHG